MISSWLLWTKRNAKRPFDYRGSKDCFLISIAILPLALWLLLYLKRPFQLGFYHDDWFMIASMDFNQFLQSLRQFPSRPMLPVVQYAASVLLGNDPFVWQFAMAILALSCAASIGLLARSIALKLLDDWRVAMLAGSLSASLWLSLPWSLGYTAFPTTMNGMVSILMFCALSGTMLSMHGDNSKNLRIYILFVLMISIFEIFWFFPIAILLLVILNRPTSGFQTVARSKVLWVMILIQLLVIINNRAVAYLGIGQNKGVSTDAFHVFNISINIMRDEFVKSTGFASAIVVLSIVVVLIGAAGLLFMKKKISAICLAVMIGSGIVYSILVYAAGGYTIQSLGLASRSTFGLSFWLALVPALVLPAAASIRVPAAYLCAALALAIIGIFSASLLENMKPWQSTWAYERELLSRIPIGEIIPHLDKDAVILVDAEMPDGTVGGFGAFWDISGALYSRFADVRHVYSAPITAQAGSFHAIATMANLSKFRTVWDGKALSQSWCLQSNPVWTIAAPTTIVVWSYPSGRIDVMRAPFSTGCGATK